MTHMAKHENDVWIMEVPDTCQKSFDLESIPSQLTNMITRPVTFETEKEPQHLYRDNNKCCWDVILTFQTRARKKNGRKPVCVA